MKQKVIDIICRIKDDQSLKNNIDGDSSIVDDVGLDSLQMINFILSIEDEFAVEIDFDSFDFAHMSSINELCNFLGKSVAK